MHAGNIDAKRLVLLLATAMLLAAPIHAQTLQSSVAQVTLGEVLNCNNSQTINLTSSSGAITLTAAITYAAGDTHGNWLYLTNPATNASTSGATTITVTVPSGGSASLVVTLNNQIGANDAASLTLTTTNPAGHTLSIPVNLQTSLTCQGLTFTNGFVGVDPATLTLNASQGTSASQNILVTNLSASPVTVTAGAGSFSPWLSVSPKSATIAPGQSVGFTITATAGSLAVGTYAGTVVLNPSAGNAMYFPVTFTVVNNGVGPTTTVGVAVSANAVNLTYVPGAILAPGRAVQITNSNGTAPVPFSIAVAQFNGPANWLTTNYSSGAVTPFSLLIGGNTAGMVSGVTYQGTVTIIPYLGPAVEIYVSLTVGAAPVVTATPTMLTFNATQGGATPPAQTVLVTGTGGLVTYSTTAIITGWLSAYPPSGGAPDSVVPGAPPPNGGAYLYITANPQGLTAGTYTGTVTIYGTGSTAGEANILVTLIVGGPAVKMVTNAASLAAGAVAPGEMVTLFADPSGAFGPLAGVPLTDDMIVNNMLPTSLGGVQVFFNGTAAPLLYSSATQINAIVPYEIAGAGSVQMTVKYGNLATAPVPLTAVATHPALFTATATGAGQGAIGQYDALGNYLGVNSAANPAARGSMITLYATGEGLTQSAVTGQITTVQATAPYTPQPQVAPTVLIDNQPATVLFYGEVPSVVAGMMQINVLVPTTARTGIDIPVSIAMGTSYSQAGVTLVVQ